MSHLNPVLDSERGFFHSEGLADPKLGQSCVAEIHGPVVVFVPEESRAVKQLVRRSAREIRVDISSAVGRHSVALSPATRRDPLGDWERLQAALQSEHGLSDLSVDYAALTAPFPRRRRRASRGGRDPEQFLKEGDVTSHSKETVLGVLRGEEVDYVPNFSGMGSITLEGLRRLGHRFNEVHTDGRKMAEAAASTYRLFGMESVVVPFDMGVSAEALGVSTKYYDKADDTQIIYPIMERKLVDSASVVPPEDLAERAARRYVKKELQRQITEFEWKPPAELAEAGRVPVVLEALRILKEEVGEEVAIGSWVLGPFTELGQTMDLEVLLRLVYKAPDVIRRHLDFMVGYLAETLALYIEAGADFVTIREMGATSSVISPRAFQSLILPSLQDLFGRVRGAPRVLHICGDTNDIIEMMAESGADALSVDQVNDLGKTREKLPNAVLLGYYKPYGAPMCEGSPEEVEAMIVDSIDRGVDAVWPGCDIWPTAPAENIEAMMGAMKKYRTRRRRNSTGG
jgi:MtaA/CmuA family methyltransferase